MGDLHEQIVQGMATSTYEPRVEGPADTKVYDFAVAHLIKLCSFSANTNLNEAKTRLTDDDATDSQWLLLLHDHIDSIYSDHIDKCMLAYRRCPRNSQNSSSSDRDAQAK